MPQESVKKLYDTFSPKYDIGDYETFQQKMQKPESRRKFFDFMGTQNYDLGDFSTFESKVRIEEPFKLADIIAPVTGYLKGAAELGVSEISKETGKKPEEFTTGERIKAAVKGVRHQPIVPLTKLTGMEKLDIEKLPDVPYPTGVPGVMLPLKFQAAVARPVVRAVEGLTSAENLVLLGVIKKAPTWLQNLGSAGFAYLMGKELPKQWKAFKEAKTPAQKTEALTSGILGLAMTGAAAKHAVTGSIAAGRRLTEVAPEFAKEVPRPYPAEIEAARSELEKAAKTAEEIGKERREEKPSPVDIEKQIREQRRQAELELTTPELQLGAIREELSKKPFEKLSRQERKELSIRARKEYQRRLREHVEDIAITEDGLPLSRLSGRRKDKIYAQARENLRKELVESRKERIGEPARAKTVEELAEELKGVTGPRPEIVKAERPPEVEFEFERPPAGELTAPPEAPRLPAGKRGILPPVTKTVTEAAPTRRGEYVGEIPPAKIRPSGFPGTRVPEPTPEPPVAEAKPEVPVAETAPTKTFRQRQQELKEAALARREAAEALRRRQQEEKERAYEEALKRREDAAAKLGSKFKVSGLKEKAKPEATLEDIQKELDARDRIVNTLQKQVDTGRNHLGKKLTSDQIEQLKETIESLKQAREDYANKNKAKLEEPEEPVAEPAAKKAPPVDVSKLTTPDEIMRAQQERITQLEEELQGVDRATAEKTIADDPILKALEERDRQIYEENQAQFTKQQAEGETEIDIEGAFEKAGLTEEPVPPKAEPSEVSQMRLSAQDKLASKRVDEVLNELEGEGLPRSEWNARVQETLRAEGFDERLINDIFRRTKRPVTEEGSTFPTTRAGRAERAVEPPPELKPKVDAVARIAKRKQVAEADYNTGIEEIIEYLKTQPGLRVYYDTGTKTWKVEGLYPNVLTAKAKEALAGLRTEAAEAGGYSVRTVGRGHNIAATPEQNYRGRPLIEGSIENKLDDLIIRKRALEKEEENLFKAKKAAEDDLIDRQLSEQEPPALIGRTETGEAVEIATRRNPSAKYPDDPEWYQKIKDAERRGEKESGDYKAKLYEVTQATAEKAERQGFTFLRRNLSEVDNAHLDAIEARMQEAYKGLSANPMYNVKLGAEAFRNLAELGYLTFKASANAAGRALSKSEWLQSMKRQFSEVGDSLDVFLEDIWNKLQKGFKPGDPLELPENLMEKRPEVTIKTEPKLPDDKPGAGKVSRPIPVAGAYTEEVIRTVGRSAPKIEAGIRQAIDYWTLQEGRGETIIRPLAKETRFRPNAFRRLSAFGRQEGQAIWDNWHEWTTKPETRPENLTTLERKALSAYDRLLNLRRTLFARLEIGQPKDIMFKRVPSFDLLDAIRSENGAVYNTLVEVLADLNKISVEQVQGRLRNFNLESFERFPTHIVTESRFGKDIAPVLATEGVSTLRALNRDTSRIAGIVRIFGKDYRKALKELRKGIPAANQGEFDLAIDSYFGVRRLENSRSMGKRIYNGLISPVISTALLARSGFYQLPQLIGATRLVGAKNFIRGLYDLTRKGTKAELEAIGAYAPAIMDFSWQKGSVIEDIGRMASQVGSTATLLKPMIDLADLGVVGAMRRFALSIKEKGGKLSPSEKNTLELLNFTPEQINLIDKRGLSGYTDADVVYSAIVNRGRKAITFTGKKGPEFTKFQLNPLLSNLIRFQGFSIGQMQQVAGTIKNLRDRFNAVRRDATAENKRQMLSSLKQTALLIGGTAAMSEATLFIKALVSGNDPDRPEDWKRVWEDLVESGFLGPVRDVSYAFADDPSRIMLPSSILNDAKDAWNGAGRYRDHEPFERAFMFTDKYATRPYTQPYDIAKNVLVASSLIKGNPTLKTANSNYWDMLRSNDAFKASEREGYNEVQAAMRELVNAVKEEEGGTLAPDLHARVNQSLAKALRLKIAEVKDPAKALNLIRMSLEGRKTVSKYYNDETKTYKIGKKNFTEVELREELRGDKYFNALVQYDKLIQSVADGLRISKKHEKPVKPHKTSPATLRKAGRVLQQYGIQ